MENLELRNRLFLEDHARDCQEIEESRRFCCEETHQARQARIDEFHSSKNLASSSQDLRHDIAETARGDREREMKRESLNTPIPSPDFQSGIGMLNHTGGSYSHGGMMDYRRIILEKYPDSVEFHSSGMRFVHEQPILRSQCSGSKELRLLH